MLSSLFVATAWADCPAIEANIRRAEEDVVSYFIADADKSLQVAADGFACSKTDTSTIVRYWLVKAMVWQLAEDPRSAVALAAARALAPDQYTEDLGPALKTQWSETDPAPLSPAVNIKVRGLRASDRVLIDTQPASPPTSPPGLHLVQVVRDDEIILGQIVVAEVGGKITVSIDDTPSSQTSVVGTAGALDYAFPMPFELTAFGVRDANGDRRHFQYDVLPASLVVQPGRDAFRARRQNSRLQMVASGVGATAGYATYLSAYKLLRDDSNPEFWLTSTLVTGTLAAAGVSWEMLLRRQRRRLKAETVDIANQVLQTGP